MKMINKVLIFILIVQTVLTVHVAQANTIYAPWLNSVSTPQSTGLKEPVERGYIVPKVSAHESGARLDVEIYQDRMNAPVTLELQASINEGDGRGRSSLVLIKTLSYQVSDNPNSYSSVRSFILDYADLNQQLRTLVPNATNLVIGPGTPLFVYARFSTGHQWGGPDRGGIFYMPVMNSQQQQMKQPWTIKSTELDLAFPINSTLANIFSTTSNSGLKIGGQIRSRVEGEGKYQILTEVDFNDAVIRLFEVARDPNLTTQVLGPEWKLKIEDRYMLRGESGNLLLDANNLPIPDPMVDTYYDNGLYEAAKSDMAIRYRYTEKNQTGSWNFKPGMGIADSENIVYRNEYAVDTTDNLPETIRDYADSTHPLNIFLPIRSISANELPSSFFQASVKITDTRYKFKLEHKSGLIVEISMDNAIAEDLRGQAKPTRFYQMEMDIDHLATKSANVAQSSNISGLDYLMETRVLTHIGAYASFNGATSMHDPLDLKEDSELRSARKAEFDLASEAIVKLRNQVLNGGDWLPGSQKYAFAAHALGLVSKKEASTSVRHLLAQTKKQLKKILSCRNLF